MSSSSPESSGALQSRNLKSTSTENPTTSTFIARLPASPPPSSPANLHDSDLQTGDFTVSANSCSPGPSDAPAMQITNVLRAAAGSLKSTLRLPKTKFAIYGEKEGSDLQKAVLGRCTTAFNQRQKERTNAPSFILHDGPPYANGDLHIGHALNKILKDMINRTEIASGKRVHYIPGWDCHGLPIELKALQSLVASSSAAEAAEKGKTLPAVKVRELARDLATKTIESQMKGFREWGVMGDWGESYNTMQNEYEVRQLGVFKEMVGKGLIYRRLKPVYWSPSSGTALAEAELEYNEAHRSRAAVIKFELEAKGLEEVSLAIWTTTPWTIPANRAVGVHPEMEYSVVNSAQHGDLLVASKRIEYLQTLPGLGQLQVLKSGILGADLVGAKYRHPLYLPSAELHPILAADFVTDDSGTGLVHLAPGHGMEDYLLCKKHGIPPYSPVDSNGRFLKLDDLVDSSTLEGKEVLYGGTKAVLAMLTAKGALLDENTRFTHKYPYDWRTKLPVIVRATSQWFADVGSIKEKAVESLKDVKFYPEAGRNRLTAFVESRSEWCISRQRAWGVPIPAVYNEADGEALLTTENIDHIISVLQEKGTDSWFDLSVLTEDFVAPQYKQEGQVYTRITETMDVWFDSGTSWTSLNAVHSESSTADLYLEGSDQHRGWFQSSLLTSTAVRSHAPFSSVLTHGFVLDPKGRKMSKSLGNVVAPQDIMSGAMLKSKKGGANGGANALRLWVAQCDYTRDVVVGETVIAQVYEVLRKFRVTARFLLGNLDDFDGVCVPYGELPATDRLALAQVYKVNKEVREAYSKYHFNKVVQLLAGYTTNDLSAFYLDVVKDRVYSESATGLSRRASQTVMVKILRNYASLLQPIVPMLAEEVLNFVPKHLKNNELDWYAPDEEWNDKKLVGVFESLTALHNAVKLGIEKARTAGRVKVNLECSVTLYTRTDTSMNSIVEKHLQELPGLWIVSQVDVQSLAPGQTMDVAGAEQDGEDWKYTQSVTVRATDVVVAVRPAKGKKCMRCWIYSAPEEGGVCGRCESVLRELGHEGQKEAVHNTQ